MITKVRLIGALGAFILAGCQSYDFEPVEPLAIAQASRVAKAAGRQNTPNLMLVVDKSGSMNATTTPGVNGCDPNCGTGSALCPSQCPTRWTELQKAMGEFLSESGNIARMGLMTFPASNECAHPTSPRIELANTDSPAELQEKANEINSTLQGIQMVLSSNSTQAGTPNFTGGGTPTGNTLAALKSYAQLADTERPNFVLLLTDGLPNCNENNPIDASNVQACHCSAGNCAPPFQRKGCLDADGTVQQITELKALDITTIVVGFGINTAEQHARETLQRMGQAGGFPRLCPNGTNEECGSDNSCNTNTRVCNNSYFSAKNSTELAEALRKIGILVGQDFCDYQLDIIPKSEEYISVLIDNQVTDRGPDTWQYEAGKVKMVGALCERLKNAQVNSPVNVEIRVIQSL